MENKDTQEASNSSEVTQSFGVDKWQRKKSRYEFEDFIVSPPSQEEGKFFQLRYGASSGIKSSTYNKISQELQQDNHGSLAGSVMSYIGVDKPRPRRRDVGGAISMDAHGGLTFDDFSLQTDSPSSDIPYSTMPDLTLEAQLFPQADPLMTLPWGRRHSLTPEDTSTSKIPSTILSSDCNTKAGNISQAVKNLNIHAKEVTYADYENITLDTSKIVQDNHQKIIVGSPKRERKRSGLEEYVSSISKHTNKSQYQIEEEEHDEEDEIEIKRRLSRENEICSEISSQDIEDNQQNRKTSYDNQYSHHDILNERCTGEQNNDMMYEEYKPLTSIDPSVVNDIENKEQNTLVMDENSQSPEMKKEIIAEETIKLKNEETNIRKISKEEIDDLRNRKTSLLALVSPFIPFKDSIAETEKSLTPTTSKSKTVSGFFCTEESEERKKSDSSEQGSSQASAQFQNTEINVSNDVASSNKPKTRKRRPKPSALREMNVWGPSSM